MGGSDNPVASDDAATTPEITICVLNTDHPWVLKREYNLIT
jgi:hypothetical protein